MVKGKGVYDCKKKCEALGKCCHNTKNRVIEKMCEVDKKECKEMGKYLKCVMVCECLCSYICTCCCEMEEVSGACMGELCGKCDKLMKCCQTLQKCLSKEMCDYLRCDEMMKCCQECKSMNKKKTKKK